MLGEGWWSRPWRRSTTAGPPLLGAGGGAVVVAAALAFRVQLVVRIVGPRLVVGDRARAGDLDADAAIVRRGVGVDLTRRARAHAVPGVVAHVVAGDRREVSGGHAVDVRARLADVVVDPVADERRVIAHEDAADAVVLDDVLLHEGIVGRLDPVPRVAGGRAALDERPVAQEDSVDAIALDLHVADLAAGARREVDPVLERDDGPVPHADQVPAAIALADAAARSVSRDGVALEVDGDAVRRHRQAVAGGAQIRGQHIHLAGLAERLRTGRNGRDGGGIAHPRRRYESRKPRDRATSTHLAAHCASLPRL